MRFIATCGLTGSLVLVMLAANSAAQEASDANPGLKVGAKAPAFTLKDQSGKERTLDEFLKKGKVALGFYRSASW